MHTIRWLPSPIYKMIDGSRCILMRCAQSERFLVTSIFLIAESPCPCLTRSQTGALPLAPCFSAAMPGLAWPRLAFFFLVYLLPTSPISLSFCLLGLHSPRRRCLDFAIELGICVPSCPSHRSALSRYVSALLSHCLFYFSYLAYLLLAPRRPFVCVVNTCWLLCLALPVPAHDLPPCLLHCRRF